MSGFPVYNIDENLRRVDLQRSLKFIVVEGSDDVAIYESMLSSTIDKAVDYEIIHSGGKPRIESFILENPNVKNCIFIVDRDFDILESEFKNLVYLNRYSIENFYFCEDVLKAVVALSLKIKVRNVHDLFNIDEFVTYNTPILLKLFYAVFYYQKVKCQELNDGETQTEGWSDTFICGDNTWKVCQIKVDSLISRLYPDGYNEELAKKYCEEEYISSGNIIGDFPGKMLKVALQRYLKDSAIRINTKYGAKFSNTDTTCTLLISNLHHSKALKENLSQVYSYLLD
ncbi:TPA: DUF4435 domain-containing protein [Providencia rettgeri]|nr:DUF4435 domain-containing protein [Providencia rettgeri]